MLLLSSTAELHNSRMLGRGVGCSSRPWVTFNTGKPRAQPAARGHKSQNSAPQHCTHLARFSARDLLCSRESRTGLCVLALLPVHVSPGGIKHSNEREVSLGGAQSLPLPERFSSKERQLWLATQSPAGYSTCSWLFASIHPSIHSTSMCSSSRSSPVASL